MSKLILPVVIVAIIIGGGAFYGGTKYAQSKSSDSVGQRGNFVRGMGTRPSTSSGQSGFTAGEVLSKDANSLIVKLRDGGSKVVFFSTSTAVSKMDTGSLADINTGTEVVITGSANQDGSLTASMVQIRPQGFGVASSTR